MNEHAFDPEALIDAMAPAIGLAIPPDSRAQVVVHLSIAWDHAAKLFAFEIDDHQDPAPVFKP
jgi:hypothetical protein